MRAELAASRALIALGGAGLVACAAAFVWRVVSLERARDARRTHFERHRDVAGEMIRVHKPLHVPFWIDKTEVTVSAYRACVDEGACTAPAQNEFCNWNKPERAHDPVNCVDHAQASAYCAWAGRTLPDAGEWWEACTVEQGNLPWPGDALEDRDCYGRHAVWQGEYLHEYQVTPAKGTCPADAHPRSASPYGALGMVGNVAEWTASEEHDSSSPSNRFVVAGGNWWFPVRATPDYIGCKAQHGQARNYRDSLIGFRCAKRDERPLFDEVVAP